MLGYSFQENLPLTFQEGLAHQSVQIPVLVLVLTDVNLKVLLAQLTAP